MKNLLRTLGLGVAMIAASSTVATAQWWPSYQDRDRDYDRGRYSTNDSAFQQGVRDGQIDARNNRQSLSRMNRYRTDWERRQYQAGYTQGWRAMANNGRYGNGQYGRYGNGNGGYGYGNNGYGNGQYGTYGNAAQVAQQYGYRDGVAEGSSDRRTGHSFRPTQDDGYRNALNGYQAGFGSQQAYKDMYRQAYQQGYQQGYNGNAGGAIRRWPY